MTAKRKVLLVDDDVGFLKATSLVLEDAGYRVLAAEDGRSGLAAAREHKPDVVVVDVIMKRPDEGFALARAIRADADLGDTKMLVLTGAGRHYQMLFEPDEQWLPVAKVLEKPTTGQQLAEEISALLADAADDED
jgi:CheY-like chemotaxis protein